MALKCFLFFYIKKFQCSNLFLGSLWAKSSLEDLAEHVGAYYICLPWLGKFSALDTDSARGCNYLSRSNSSARLVRRLMNTQQAGRLCHTVISSRFERPLKIRALFLFSPGVDEIINGMHCVYSSSCH